MILFYLEKKQIKIKSVRKNRAKNVLNLKAPIKKYEHFTSYFRLRERLIVKKPV